MTVEAKIRQLLEASQDKKELSEYSAGDVSRPRQGNSQDASYDEEGNVDNDKPRVNVSKDNSKSAKTSTSGDTTRPRQGNSQDASYDDAQGDTVGKKVSARMTKDTSMTPKIKGDATNDMQGSSKKATYSEDTETDDEDLEDEGFDEDEDESLEELSKKTLGSYISKASKSATKQGYEAGKNFASGSNSDAHKEAKKGGKRNKGIDMAVKKLTKEEVEAIFGNVTEEVQEKVTSIFEAAVIARVNEEMISIEEQLIEGYNIELEEAIEANKQDLVEKVDSYLNYIADTWLEDNKVQVENILKLQAMENFMESLKTLFVENYIEIPEDRVDVVEALQNQVNDLEDRLNEEINKNIESQNLITEARRLSVVDGAVEGLADTEIDKFNKLIEGIEFDDEDTYAEKLKVIRQSHFNKKLDESKTEEIADENGVIVESDSTMSKYKQAISRSVRK